MHKLRFPALILALVLMAACKASAAAVQTAISETQAAWTPVPSQTRYPTYTLQPVVILVVTVTSSPTPLFTPTITLTPSPTLTRTPTLDALKMPHEDGNYLVGVDIAPGIWRNNGTSDNCYWARLTRTGDIIDNYIGYGGGTAYIASTDFGFRSNRCAIWTYLSPP